MQFSEDQEMRFTEGDCWLLALEMQALEPRLRVAVIGDRSVGSVDDWIHVGVCTEMAYSWTYTVCTTMRMRSRTVGVEQGLLWCPKGRRSTGLLIVSHAGKHPGVT